MELTISLDVSKSVNRKRFPKTEEFYDHILNVIGLTNDIEYFNKGIICYFSYIGSEEQPLMAQVILDKGTYALLDNMKNRAEKVEKFKQDLKKAIGELLSKPSDHSSTHVLNSLSYQIEVMKENTFSQDHRIYIVTDAIETGVMDYKTLEKIQLTKTLPDNIKSQMDFGDLSTFDITFLNCASPEIAPISNLFTAFWVEHLQKSGATARSRTNLIKTY